MKLMNIVVASLSLGGSSLAWAVPVFIGTAGEGVFRAELNEESGTLSKPVLAVKGQGMQFLAISEATSGEKRLFTTARVKDSGGVMSFSIKEDGLQKISEQTYEGRQLCHITLDETKRVLLGADYGGGSVVSFSVNESGEIGEVGSFVKHEGSSVNARRQKRPHAHSFYPGPNNQFGYAPDLGTDRVEIYKIDHESAKLTSAGAGIVPPGSGPRHMKFGKDGKYAYVLNELTLTITTFVHDPKEGGLKEIQTLSVLPEGADGSGMSCSEILVSKDGKFIYCATRDGRGKKRDVVSALKIGEDGKLTFLETEPTGVWIPRNINLSPSGKFLLIAGQKSNEVAILKVNLETGLMEQAGARVSVPKPMCIAFP